MAEGWSLRYSNCTSEDPPVQAMAAAKGRELAEAQQAAAEAGLQDARLHMDWQDMRIADLEGRDVSQMATRCNFYLCTISTSFLPCQ